MAASDGRRLTADGWLLGAAAFFAAFIVRARVVVGGTTYYTLFDDAMISMQYARNLAAGHGLVWNAGDVPVEGITNPLWTLWMALLHLTGVPEAKLGLLVALTGAAILLVQLPLVRRIGEEVSDGAAAVAEGAVILVALSYAMAFWSLRGMEVGALSCTVAWGALLVLRLRREWSSRRVAALAAVLALLPLIRMDGAVPAAVLAFFAVLEAPAGRRSRAAAALCGALAASLAAQTAARLAYYGDLLPNTYYLKMSGVALLERIARGGQVLGAEVRQRMWPLLVLPLALGPRLADRRVQLLLALVVAQLAYSVWVGGDAWEWMDYANRYVTVAVPAMAVLAAGGLAALRDPVLHVLAALGPGGARTPGAPPSPGASLGFSRVAAVAVAAYVSGAAFAEWARTGGAHVHDDREAVTAAVRVRLATTPDATIAVVWAGTVPYFSHRRAVDLLGKSDRAVARLDAREPFLPGHVKWNYRHSIGRFRPDVVLQLWQPTPADHHYLRDAGYERLDGQIFVRRDSRAVDRVLLREGVSGMLR